MTKADKNMVYDLDYEGIEFPVSGKEFGKIEKKNNVCIIVFCYESNFILFINQMKNYENCVDLLLITDGNKSQYIYIKYFNRIMCNKTKNKNKKHFCKYCLQYLSSERILVEFKETCFKINGNPTVKLRSGSIKFKNSFKQLAVPFKLILNLF